jgi:hypothetical protein
LDIVATLQATHVADGDDANELAANGEGGGEEAAGAGGAEDEEAPLGGRMLLILQSTSGAMKNISSASP